MKKYFKFALALMTALAMLLAAGCGSENNGEAPPSSSSPDFGEGVTYISDTLYYTFYLAANSNYEDYAGKKYAVDGMFHLNKFEGGEIPMLFRYHREVDPTDGKEYAYYRGFNLEGEDVPTNLPEKTWIRVVGTLEAEPHGDHVHVSLVVESFEQLDTPGSEYVE